MNENHIPKLLTYATRSIAKLAETDSSLAPLVTLLRQLPYGRGTDDMAISDKEAAKLTKNFDEEFSKGQELPTVFSDDDIDIIEKLARKFLELAVDTHSNNAHLKSVARYLNPLFSQDSRTNSVGWDMAEYIDWYFLDTSAEERRKYATDFLDEWMSVLHHKNPDTTP